MARLSFIQGIVRHGVSPFFLQNNGNDVDLVISPDSTTLAFADGLNKNYLYTESVTVSNAWVGVGDTTTEKWLYWQLNLVTGVRTFGFTEIEPTYGNSAPVSPANGAMWFDTNSSQMTMKEWNGSRWVRVIRLFAAKYVSGQILSPIDGSSGTDFTGTQIGIYGDKSSNNASVGSLVFDTNGKPVINQGGKFFTTEDEAITAVPTGASLKINDIILKAQATEPIPEYSVVVLQGFNTIQLADDFVFIDKIYGIVEEDVSTGEVATVTITGYITNQLWDFTDSVNNPDMSGNVNDPIYVKSDGSLTTDAGQSGVSAVPVAAIINVNTIIFSPGLYGSGNNSGGSASDHGSLNGLLDDDHTQYHTDVRGDIRYYEKTIADSTFAPISHNHTKSDIIDFAHTHVEADITDLDKYTQAEVDAAFLSLTGGTLTGQLTLNGDPLTALQAATKQYVDAVAAGIDAKDAVVVATTVDIGGSYSPTGGSSATGNFTGVDLSALDGTLTVDYDLSTGSRVLVKDQTDPKQNGIYVVVDITTPSNATIERAPDQDGSGAVAEVGPGNYTFVTEGATIAGKGWIILSGTASGPNNSIILNTDDINWSQVSSATAYTAGQNINIDLSNVISVIDASSGGTVDAKTWDGAGNSITSPATGNVLIYNTGTSNWENDFLSTIRDNAGTTEVSIDGSGNIGLVSVTNVNNTVGADFIVNATNNVNLSASTALNLSSVGNGNITTTGSGSINVNSAVNVNVTVPATGVVEFNSDVFNVRPIISGTPHTTELRLFLENSASHTVFRASENITGNTSFILPVDNGTAGYVLSTDGSGVTSWIAAGGGGGTSTCLESNGDTFVGVGGTEAIPCTDIQSGDVFVRGGTAAVGSPPVDGGVVKITGGNGTTTATGGNVVFNGATAAGGGGDLIISSGNAETNGNTETNGSNNPGDVFIVSGTLTAGGVDNRAGNINITTADVGYDTPVSGEINIIAGSSTDTTSPPKISINNNVSGSSYGGSINIGIEPTAIPSPPNGTGVDINITGTSGYYSSGNVNISVNGLHYGGDGYGSLGDIKLATTSHSAQATGGNILLQPSPHYGTGAPPESIKPEGHVIISNSDSSSTNMPELRFFDSAYLIDPRPFISFRAPVNLSASVVMTLPDGIPSLAQVIQITNASQTPSGIYELTTQFSNLPYDISGNLVGAVNVGDVVSKIIIANRSVNIPATGHAGHAGTAPTGADAIFDVFVDGSGTSSGTITFANGSNTATFSGFGSGIPSFSYIEIKCTTPSGITDVAITLFGELIG